MHRGFSLVELSIVLVILGLLTGGILAGQSLIRAAELRAVTTEYNRYVTATQSFRDKYFAIPGDMSNATKFWGPLDGGDGIGIDCRDDESTSIATCNGDGNGQVCQDATCAALTFEQYLYWKHMANAGLIEGNYSGAVSTTTAAVCPGSGGTDQVKPGCNVPISRVSSAAWINYWKGSVTGDPYLFDGDYGNMMTLSLTPTGNGGLIRPPLKPEEMWNIDTKMDDGRPAYGKVVGARWNLCATGAASTADLANASYNLQNQTLLCTPVFRNAY